MRQPVLVHGVSDTAPTYTFKLRKGGAAVSLAGATVAWKLKRADNSTATGSCTITDASNGVVTLAFSGSNASIPGAAKLEIVVTFSGGAIQHGKWMVPFYFRSEYEDPVLP